MFFFELGAQERQMGCNEYVFLYYVCEMKLLTDIHEGSAALALTRLHVLG